MIYYSNYDSNNHNLSIMLSYHIIIKVLRSQDRIKDTKKSTNHHITRMAMATMSARVTSLITMMASLHMFPTNLIRPSWPGRCFQGFSAWRRSRLLSPPSSCRSGQDDADDHAREADDGDEDSHQAYFHQTKSHGDPTHHYGQNPTMVGMYMVGIYAAKPCYAGDYDDNQASSYRDTIEEDKKVMVMMMMTMMMAMTMIVVTITKQAATVTP